MNLDRPFRSEAITPPAALLEFEAEWRRRAPAANTPVELEIGSGVGWRAIRFARENPEWVLLAVERTREKFEKFQRRVRRTEAKSGALPGLFPVHADAVAFAVHAVADQSLDRVSFYYPNPSAKNPAGRWFCTPFFGFLLTKLCPGGEVLLRTNEVGYFEEALAAATGRWRLRDVRSRRFTRTDVDPKDAATHFERKYLERGETCFELSARVPGGEGGSAIRSGPRRTIVRRSARDDSTR